MSKIYFKTILVARQSVGRGYRRNKSKSELINVENGDRYMGIHYAILFLHISDKFFLREVLLNYPWVKEKVIVEIAEYFT